ncbi:hypothetical protein ACFOSH_36395 [Amycolatopsis speibonae]|uniref:Nitroreductase TM1586 domain-containing protein n=1 Tax=Amycolatopsis speibonae TaxID=1450224 RepID=A0ABV7PA79_9PSEU
MILTDFPVLTTALKAAVRAPSPHNIQPWFFRVGADVVEVHLDEDRVLLVCDPDGRYRPGGGESRLPFRADTAIGARSRITGRRPGAAREGPCNGSCFPRPWRGCVS